MIQLTTSRINHFFSPKFFFPSIDEKYGKIAAIALSVISAIAVVYYMCRKYAKEKKITNPSPQLPPLSSKDRQLPHFLVNQKNNNPSSHTAPQPTQNSDSSHFTDATLARKLQRQISSDEENEGVNSDDQSLFPFGSDFHDFGTVSPPQTHLKTLHANNQACTFSEIEDLCGKIAEHSFSNRSFSATESIKQIEPQIKQEIENTLHEIVKEFEQRFRISHKLIYGSEVPAYYANDSTGNTPDQRKYLSLAGIRNLLMVGPSIIDDFRDTQYLGGEHHYQEKKGLKAFKFYTGNTVDLDTKIEAKNDREALQIAETMVVKFGEKCGVRPLLNKLTASAVSQALPKRKLHLPPSHEPIHNAGGSHTDRSNHGIWKRTFRNETEYYVNIPNHDIVLLATLRLPYMLAELAYMTKHYKNGSLLNEFYTQLFNKGISDKCFNDKARTFLDFYHTWKAKLNEIPSPEEEARHKLATGGFGQSLKELDAHDVIANAYDQGKLSELLSNYNMTSQDGLCEKEWITKNKPQIVQLLNTLSLWEKVLYRTEAGKDYFLLNESTLTTFLPSYYKAMVW
ncbi:MAG: hypothetical protein ACH350_02515 [Parachlamydiaceae bacterium]